MSLRRFLAKLLRAVPRDDVLRLHQAHVDVLQQERRLVFRNGVHFAGYAAMIALGEEARTAEAEVGRGCCIWERAPANRADEAWRRLATLLRELGDAGVLERLTRPVADLAPLTERPVPYPARAPVRLVVPVQAAEADGLVGDLIYHLRVVYLRDGLGLSGDDLQARLPS